MKKRNKIDVITIGSVVVDYFLDIEGSFKQVRLGDKILAKNIDKYVGGSAANSAVALKKFGMNVKCLGKVGKDHNAKFIEDALKKRKVVFDKKIGNCFTSTSFIVTGEKDKDRVIFNHKGCSNHLTEKDITKLNSKWIYLGSLADKGFKVYKKIIKQNKNILFNPSLYLCKIGHKKLKFMLDKIKVLIVNKEEAQALVNSKKTKLNLIKRVQSICKAEAIVITDGPNDLYVYVKDKEQGKYYSATPPNVKVVNTTGSGDAFNSGFLGSVIIGHSYKDSIKLGLINSVHVIQKKGAENGLLSYEECVKRLKKIDVKLK